MTRRCRVLLVDDEAMVRRSTARLLGIEFDVTEASNLAEARASLAQAVPDVVITDLDLGAGGRGEDLLLEARTLYPAVDRVVLSGSGPDRLEGVGGLAALVFPKGSVHPVALVDAVRALCRGRQS